MEPQNIITVPTLRHFRKVMSPGTIYVLRTCSWVLVEMECFTTKHQGLCIPGITLQTWCYLIRQGIKIKCALSESLNKWKKHILNCSWTNDEDTVNCVNRKIRVLRHPFLLCWFISLNAHLWFHTAFPITIALRKKILGHSFYMVVHSLTQYGRILFSHYHSGFRWHWKTMKGNPSSGQIFKQCVLFTLLWWKKWSEVIGIY